MSSAGNQFFYQELDEAFSETKTVNKKEAGNYFSANFKAVFIHSIFNDSTF